MDSRKESGLAYVAILILLAVMSALGFAFIFKAGTQTSATMNRSSGMQAHYLAESAANHAMWRILNDPTFAPAADKYYMHSLANGRYGYKVRMPTETPFATVATVGAIENNVVNQSYVQYIIPSNELTAYGTSSSPNPKYRRLIGAQWNNPSNLGTGSSPMVHWAEMEGCPIRKEAVAGFLDGNDDISLIVWDGTGWVNRITFTTNADMNYKCFDIAYESQSGNALAVGRYDGTTTVHYNIWDGTAWLHANSQPAFNIASGALRLVTMASCPGNNDILIATVNWNHELELFRWNGSAFSSLGTIESSTETDEYGVVQIVYERQSGDALVLWTARGPFDTGYGMGLPLDRSLPFPVSMMMCSCFVPLRILPATPLF
jgi:Tfp pilus assembly protein PilX